MSKDQFNQVPNRSEDLLNMPAPAANDAAAGEVVREDAKRKVADAGDSGGSRAGQKARSGSNVFRLPEFVTGPGTLAANIADSEKVLAETGRFFLHNGVLVTIQEDQVTGEARFREVSRSQLKVELDARSRWFKQERGGQVATRPPADVCQGLLQPRVHQHLRRLSGVARQPYFRPDGSLVTTQGYDEATGIYAHFDPSRFPVPSSPRADQVHQSLDKLKQLLREVPFVGERDRSATLAAMLTAVVRVGLDAAPLFLVRAHQAGTGKTFLCRLIALFATGGQIMTNSFPGGDEECGKVVLAALRTAPEVIEFDNLIDDLLPHKSLCTILTSKDYTGRVLGQSEMMTVGTRCLFLASGNNVSPIGDMARRCVTIDLDAGCDLPATKSYSEPELHKKSLERRDELVTAALTVIQGWVAEGRGDLGVAAIASFGQWSDLCRLPLVKLGLDDPATSMFEGMQYDPQRSKVGRVLETLFGHFGDGATQCREMVKRAHDTTIPRSQELLEALQDALGSRTVDSVGLGRWLARHVGHVVGDLRLKKSDVTRSSQVWIVEKIKH